MTDILTTELANTSPKLALVAKQYANHTRLGHAAIWEGDQARDAGNPSAALQSYLAAYRHYTEARDIIPNEHGPLKKATRILMNTASRAVAQTLHHHVLAGGGIELYAHSTVQ